MIHYSLIQDFNVLAHAQLMILIELTMIMTQTNVKIVMQAAVLAMDHYTQTVLEIALMVI